MYFAKRDYVRLYILVFMIQGVSKGCSQKKEIWMELKKKLILRRVVVNVRPSGKTTYYV